MLSGLFSSSVYSLAIAREKGGNRDAQSQTANRKRVNLSNNQTKTPNGVKTFTFIAWEPPLECLAWKILITDNCEVNEKGACLKISFTSVLKTWALAPLQITASLCEGTIYLLLCCVITFSNKRQNLRVLLSCSCIVCTKCWVHHDWIFSSMNYNV